MKHRKSEGPYFQGINISKIDNAADEKYFSDKGIDINKEIENLREKVNNIKSKISSNNSNSAKDSCGNSLPENLTWVKLSACRLSGSDDQENLKSVNILSGSVIDGEIREDEVGYRMALKTPKNSEISEKDKNYLLETAKSLNGKQ